MIIKRNYTTGGIDYYGYTDEADRKLKEILESSGYKYKQGAFGGQPSEIVEAIAHFYLDHDYAKKDIKKMIKTSENQ